MKKITAAELAKKINTEIIGDSSLEIIGVASLAEAEEQHVSFLGNKKYAHQVATSKAKVILVSLDYEDEVPDGKAFIKCEDPTAAFSTAIDYFAPPPVKFEAGIHYSAVISESAQIGPGCYIGPGVVIEENVHIGRNSVLIANIYIGHKVKIGSNTMIYPGVGIRERCEIGDNVIIHFNAAIGADGFGYAPSPFGIVKIPQVGIVQIEDEVEIGANCTIDRARFGKTILKMGVKLDDQVHVAHNVTVGEFSMLIGQCGIAGSTKIGQGVIVAAQAGISGHITLGDGAKIAGQAGVVKDVPPGGVYIGTPSEPVKEFIGRVGLPKKFKQMKKKISDLEAVIVSMQKDIEKLNS